MISPSDLYAGDIVMTSVPEPWHLAVVLRCEGDTVYLSGRDIVDDNSQPQCFCAKEEDIVPYPYRISPLKKLFHKDGILGDVVYIRDTIITITQLYGGPYYTFRSENSVTKERYATGGQGVHDFFRCLRKTGLESEVDTLSETIVKHYKLK